MSTARRSKFVKDQGRVSLEPFIYLVQQGQSHEIPRQREKRGNEIALIVAIHIHKFDSVRANLQFHLKFRQIAIQLVQSPITSFNPSRLTSKRARRKGTIELDNSVPLNGLKKSVKAGSNLLGDAQPVAQPQSRHVSDVTTARAS